jgi:cytochrome b561
MGIIGSDSKNGKGDASMWRNSTERYGSLQIGLHWLMLLLLVLVYALIELREFFPKGSDPRELMKALHFMFGISVLLLVIVRIAARFSGPTPQIRPPMGRGMELAARLMHLALYVFMIAMPIAGWLIVSAKGKPVPFFGLELPPLIGPDKALAERIEDVHKAVGEFGYYLIGLHAVAALYHHHFMKDNTLLRMLPAKRSSL